MAKKKEQEFVTLPEYLIYLKNIKAQFKKMQKQLLSAEIFANGAVRKKKIIMASGERVVAKIDEQIADVKKRIKAYKKANGIK